jgi:stage V sporulation protein B
MRFFKGVFVVMKDQAQKTSPWTGVFFLTLSGILVKVIGMFFKIPLASILGDSGMGYFNGAYTVYIFFYTISTAGIPAAVSILVSESLAKKEEKVAVQIGNSTIGLLAFVGFLLSSLLLLFCVPISGWIGNTGSAYALAAIAPALFFSCISGVLRGFFQGYQRMVPTALSQIAEAVGKLTIGLFLARLALRRGYSAEKVAAFAIMGITIGSALSMLLMLLYRGKFSKETGISHGVSQTVGFRKIAIKLARIALPITLSSTVISLSGMVDLVTVMHRLIAYGYSQQVANALYGNYSALAVPVVNMPIVLIVPISTGLIPYLTTAKTTGDFDKIRKTIKSSLQIALLIAIPSSLGLCVLGKPILRLLFEDSSADSAAFLLQLLAPSLVLIALSNVTGSMLQALGGFSYPVLSMSLGAISKWIVSTILIGKYGMMGAPVGTLVCYFVICFCNFTFLAKLCGNRILLEFSFHRLFIKPLLSAFCACFLADFCYYLTCTHLSLLLSVGISILVAVFVYLFFILLTGYLSNDLLEELPKRKGLQPIFPFLKK